MKLSEKINNLKSHNLNCNIFSVYDYNAYSMQELLCQFYTKINECIDISNNTIDLTEWLVNEGLSIEVSNNISNLIEEGFFETIINEKIFNELNDKIDGNKEELENSLEDFYNDSFNKFDNIDNEILENKDEINILKNELTYRVCSVKDFGAIGDGVTDDTKSIMNAIKFLENNPFSRLIFEKNKRYKIDNGLELECSNVIIEGNNSTLITNNPSIGNFIINGKLGGKYQEYNGNSNIHIKELNFEGYRDLSNCAISFGHAKNIVVENCKFTNFNSHCLDIAGVDGLKVISCSFIGHTGINNLHQECIQLDYNLENSFGVFGEYDGTPTKNVLIDSCIFTNSSEYKNWAKCVGTHTYVNQKYIENITIQNCQFNCDEGAITFYNTMVKNLYIVNNTFNSLDECVSIIAPPKSWNYDKDIIRNINIKDNYVVSSNYFTTIKTDLHDVLNVNVTNNLINCKKTGIQIRSINDDNGQLLTNINISRNKIYGKSSSSNGIYFDKTHRVVIDNNYFSDCMLDSILIDNGNTINISMNNIYRCGRNGININKSSTIQIYGNKIKDICKYGILYGFGNSVSTSDLVIKNNDIKNIGTFEGVQGIKRAIGVFKTYAPTIQGNSILNTSSDTSIIPDCFIYVDSATNEPIVFNNYVFGKCSGATSHIYIESPIKHEQNNLIIAK